MLVGTPWVEDGRLYNACALLDGGKIPALRFKFDLPNYGVFDEKRVFAPALPRPVDLRGVRIGVPICEDIWTGSDVVETPGRDRAPKSCWCRTARPIARDKLDVRLNIAVARVIETGLPLVYLNMVGGQDELVFDGGSFALNADRSLAAQLPAFEERSSRRLGARGSDGWRCDGPSAALPEGDEADYAACVLGLRDYVDKNGFPGVRARPLRRHRFRSVRRDGGRRARAPTRALRDAALSLHRASRSRTRALRQGARRPLRRAADRGSRRGLRARCAGCSRESRATSPRKTCSRRARGMMLMAISNKFGAMVVTTGNKSEMSVGYATLYGDMNGGFNPIKDLYKMRGLPAVRAAQPLEARRRARAGRRGDSRPSSRSRRPRNCARTRRTGFAAALRVLDAILERLVEQRSASTRSSRAASTARPCSGSSALLYIAEYKRRQSAPGVKVTAKNFGRDRRYPITNRFRDKGEPSPAADETLVSRGSKASIDAFEG